jgi:hypothetical protein
MTLPIERLADAQLRAYNRQDVEAFCGCFSDDVEVLDEHGNVTLRGMTQFRARYAELFTRWLGRMSATIHQRMVLGRHLVERETYERRTPEGAIAEQGEVLVRYTHLEGAPERIRVVQFLVS